LCEALFWQALQVASRDAHVQPNIQLAGSRGEDNAVAGLRAGRPRIARVRYNPLVMRGV
jgi:hypothetical protein